MSGHRLSNAENRLNEFTTFGEVEVPDALRVQVSTGISELDLVFAGEGIRPSTVVLWTGLPGAGKTTLSLMAAASLAEQGHVVLYNSCEESREQLKMNVERMALAGIDKVYISNISEVNKLVKYARALRKAKLPTGKHFFMFVDSMQTIEVEQEMGKRGRPPSQETQAVQAAWLLSGFAKDTLDKKPGEKPSDFVQIIMIGQVTKDGVFAGKQELKHAIDVHLHMDVDTDKGSDMKGERFLSAEKNRFGLTGVPFYYKCSKDGIRFVLAKLPSEEDDEWPQAQTLCPL